MGAFYEAFPADLALSLVRRLEFRFTPKHVSWLNIAAGNVGSSLNRQCRKGRRIGDLETLRDETIAWEKHSNEKQRGVDWQFQIGDARTKRKSLYPCLLF